MRRWIPGIILAITLLALAGPLALLEAGRPHVSAPEMEKIRKSLPSELKDQDDYHLPVIETMREEWPQPDIVAYESATAPGYHLLMAGATELTGSSGKGVMLALNLLVGVAFVVVVWWTASCFTSPWSALALVAPLAASKYVFAGLVWLTTDNLAWALVFMSLGLCVVAVRRARWSPWLLLLAGVLAAGAVWTRQIHVWTAAPIGFVGLLGSPLGRLVPGFVVPAGSRPTGSWACLGAGCVGAAMPVAVVGVFLWLWGGLVPLSSDAVTQHAAGVNLAAPAFALSMCAVLGVFYVASAWRGLAGLKRVDLWVVGAAVVGALAALLPATAWMRNVRDYGWLWRPSVQKVPDVADRSLLLALLAPCGALVLLGLWRSASVRGARLPALVLLLSMSGWLLAQSANAMAWQRYFEPAVLVMLVWLAAMSLGAGETEEPGREGRLVLLPAVLLGLFQAGLTVMLVIRPGLVGLL